MTKYFNLVIITIAFTLAINACDQDMIDVSGVFVKFYSDAEAVDMVQASEGGTVFTGRDNSASYLIKVDVQGNELWNKVLPSFQVKDIIINTSSFPFDYIVLGDFNDGSFDEMRLLFFRDDDGFSDVAFTPNLDDFKQTRCLNKLSASHLAFDTDGGLLVFGSSEDCNGFDKPFVVKIDINKIVQWKTDLGINDPSSDVFLSKTIVSDGYGDFIYASTVASSVQPDVSYIEISKFNSSSRQESVLSTLQEAQVSYLARDLISTPTGYTLIGKYSQNVFTVNVSQEGSFMQNTIRKLELLGTEISDGYALFATQDGGYVILAAVHTSFQTNNNFLLWKVDSRGVDEWMPPRVIGGDKNEIGVTIQQLPNGRYIVLGTSVFSDEKILIQRIVLIKTNSRGELIN